MVAYIVPATADDIARLDDIAAQMPGRKEQGYFARCLAENRTIFVAGEEGYVQVNWNPAYAPFREQGIPEIQDLAVIPDARNTGLGRQLVERCEEEARAAGKDTVGISVGLYNSYGPAQRLYIHMGYVPDGAGVMYDDEPVQPGGVKPLDDFLTLKMVKKLS